MEDRWWEKLGRCSGFGRYGVQCRRRKPDAEPDGWLCHDHRWQR